MIQTDSKSLSSLPSLFLSWKAEFFSAAGNMGCYASKNADSKASRVARWRATGIVALRDSKLKTFPDEVLDMDRSVRTLDLTNNRIVDIPMEVCKLINMQRLVLADNLIERLPMNLGKLQSLRVMILDGNHITTLPDELGQLVRLERLSVSRNLLSSLPETIGSLRNLLLIDVSNNKLKSLPESIGSCFSLEELQANDNLMEDLPSSLCNLIHLKSLRLDNNNIGQLPSNLLKDCKALQNASLHGNPILMDQFQQMEGFEDFEARRKKKFDKQIDSNTKYLWRRWFAYLLVGCCKLKGVRILIWYGKKLVQSFANKNV
ncbi:unnamed protein product [Citrullus colocynthis]|uniref:Disease resistance R13L4/SHOC-2-like LRR domain-containing protein n=1 Tax=Citrullus colocynthis TaxID=252529 RepID=A0ABP0ZD88_9ROSI